VALVTDNSTIEVFGTATGQAVGIVVVRGSYQLNNVALVNPANDEAVTMGSPEELFYGD
jgi:hypothetical protein